jgi:hypothetical protein
MNMPGNSNNNPNGAPAQPSPEQMLQMMNSPMMQGLMDNPEMMQQAMQMTMQTNPQLCSLLERNPELQQYASDVRNQGEDAIGGAMPNPWGAPSSSTSSSSSNMATTTPSCSNTNNAMPNPWGMSPYTPAAALSSAPGSWWRRRRRLPDRCFKTIPNKSINDESECLAKYVANATKYGWKWWWWYAKYS